MIGCPWQPEDREMIGHKTSNLGRAVLVNIAAMSLCLGAEPNVGEASLQLNQ